MKALSILVVAINIACFVLVTAIGSPLGVINLAVALVLVYQLTRNWEYL